MKGDMDSDFGRKVFVMSDTNDSDRNQTPKDEQHFRQVYFYKPPPEETLKSKIKSSCQPRCLLKVLPILQWLPEYKKEFLISDFISGLTVAVMHIPQGMAYALLGGVPPVVGIYMAFFPVLMYIIFGTSRHVSMGTFAVVCMMVGKSVDTYAHVERNATISHNYQQEHIVVTYTPIEVATAVCLCVGLWQTLLSILQLGSLSVLLSQTLVSGFTTGAAVHVFTSQIRNLLGIKVKRYSGPLKIIYSYIDIFSNIGSLNIYATMLSSSFIILLVVFNEVCKPFIQKKFKKNIPLPIEILVIIIGTLLSKYLNVKEEYGVSIVNHVPTGLPPPSLPPLSLLPNLVMDGLIIAIVAISINVSMASIFAQKLGYEIDGNQEMLASGMGNIFGAFFSCMPYAVSLSRSLVQESAGGKTQITSVFSSGTLVLVLLFIAHFFEPLPYCVLSTIIVVALKGMFKQVFELPNIYKNSKLDGMVWILSFLSVIILDIDYGLAIGLISSVASLLIQSQDTKVVALGRIPNTQTYLNLDCYSKAQGVPNVQILQIVGGLHFANANAVKRKIAKRFMDFTKNVPISLLEEEKQNRTLSLILDFSCVPYIDPSAIKSLKMICKDVQALNANLLLCGCQPEVYGSLENSEFFDSFPSYLVFHSLNDAIEHAKTFEHRRSIDGTFDFSSKF